MVSTNTRFAAALIAACSMSVPSLNVTAATLQFEATDLVDTTVGQDLWQYRYVPTASFNAFEGFNVLFAPTLYSDLQDPPAPVNGDWAAASTQPDAGLPADGLYTATAQLDNAALTDPFTITFVFHGAGAPGSQSFEFFNSNFDVVGSGLTTPVNVVPLPAAVMLFGSGLFALGARRRRVR